MVESVFGELDPIPVRLTPLLEAQWSYGEFEKLMPYGADSEGQAYAVSTGARMVGDRLSGAYHMAQYPRWRADGIYLAEAHGLVETESKQHVMVKASGYVIPADGKPDTWTISHWMRFWTAAPELAWLNETIGVGCGSMANGEAHVRYFAAAPTTRPTDPPSGAPTLRLLGTARWDYPEYEAVRPFGDKEGIGFATSSGLVRGDLLHGRWRGWHYPTYLRNGLYQLDAHVAIDGPSGLILLRHAGLATRPTEPADGLMYDVVQYATFTTEVARLGELNRTLAIGVGYVHQPGVVRLSYYGMSG